MKTLKYFYGSFFVTVLGVAIGVFFYPNNPSEIIYAISILAILEISLSFDNAVINAKILGQMPEIWQKAFIFIGLPIAVFGMRLVFPILLVSISSNVSFVQVINLALNNPTQYQTILESSMPYICSFGGSFLLMVFFNFFLSENQGHHWLPILENNILIRKIRQYDGGYILLAVVIGFLVIYFTNNGMQGEIAIAYLLGIIVHESIGLINSFFGSPNIDATTVARNGLMGFIYLEIIDASFSFDGVVGAFAISTNIIVIMIGLGIGAMFVRSLTILFVERKTLSKYIYVEHGAHYAIGFLATMLLLKVFMHIPEWFSGSVGVLILVVSFVHSIVTNKSLQE
ncbi:integral membrane protein [Francisella sp. W12-1067]|nr:integral membrane protein [Francisella sp. W12-1067]